MYRVGDKGLESSSTKRIMGLLAAGWISTESAVHPGSQKAHHGHWARAWMGCPTLLNYLSRTRVQQQRQGAQAASDPKTLSLRMLPLSVFHPFQLVGAALNWFHEKPTRNSNIIAGFVVFLPATEWPWEICPVTQTNVSLHDQCKKTITPTGCVLYKRWSNNFFLGTCLTELDCENLQNAWEHPAMEQCSSQLFKSPKLALKISIAAQGCMSRKQEIKHYLTTGVSFNWSMLFTSRNSSSYLEKRNQKW